MKKIFLMSVLALGTTFSNNALSESVTTPLEKLVSELAEKPEQHAAIANYYKDKAAKAREEAAEHKKMASTRVGHSKSPLTQQNWENHCKKLSSTLEEAAKEYDELAKLHSESAQ